jgi:predicted permease
MSSPENVRQPPGLALSRWLDDLRLAWRSLAATPLVTGLSILTLALGIGASAAIFTVLNGVVLTPLSHPDAERLVRLRSAVPGLDDGAVWGLSSAQYVHLREHADRLESVGVWQVNAQTVRMGELSDRAVLGIVSHEMLAMIGARATLGRTLGARDDRPAAAPAVMLSDAYWRLEFASDPSIIGATMAIGDEAFEIIGVMAPEVRLPGEAGAPRLMERPDLWITQRLDPSGPFYNSHVFMGLGRLADGVGLEAARTQLRRLTADLPTAFPSVYDDEFMRRFGFDTEAVRLKDVVVGDTAGHLWLLFGMVILVLLAAVANVVNLFLARVEARHQEWILRAAMGASLGVLGRHILVQSLVQSIAGAVLGVLAALLGVRLLVANAPAGLPRADNVDVDGLVAGFVVIVALAIGALLALLVLLRLRGAATRPMAGSDGHRSTAGTERQRIRSGLVAGQVAIALVLLAGAGMLLQSFARLASIDPGFDPERVTRMQIHLSGERYRDHLDVWQFYRELISRTEALPGVLAAGAGNPLPLSGHYGCWVQGFEDAGVAQRLRERGTTACGDIVVTAPGYFETLGIPVLAGRTLSQTDLDHPDAGSVVVSRSFADRFWPDEDPLGKGVRPLAAPGDTPRYYRVVGVVGDLPAATLEGVPATAVYYPMIPVPGEGFPISPSLHLNLLIRTNSDDRPPLIQTIRDLVRRLDPAAAIDSAGPMTALVDRSTSRARFSMWLLGIAALIALLLSAAGLYGVVSYLVARRTHEIGIRLALGSARRRVRRLVIARSIKMIAAGLIVGAVAAVALGYLIHGMFYDLRPSDPTPYFLAVSVLLGVALLASFIPAHQAARTEPVEALRHN